MNIFAAKKVNVVRVLSFVVLVVLVAIQFTGRTTVKPTVWQQEAPKFQSETTDVISPPVDSTDLRHGPSMSKATSLSDVPLELETKPPAPDFPQETAETKRATPLYIITYSSRPSLLTRSISYVLPFVQCFDLHWVIVHSVADAHLRQTTGPLFRNVFPWITEIFTFQEDSAHGHHERNVGIDHVIQMAANDIHNNGSGLIYFMDDDNTLSMDLCRDDTRAMLSTNKMYYADQYSCGQVRLNTTELSTKWETGLVGSVDKGSWLTPVWLLRHNTTGSDKGGIRWHTNHDSADGLFFSEIVRTLLALPEDEGKDERIVRLESVKFHYNELITCTPQPPWTEDQARQSLESYHSLVKEMQTVRESLSNDEKADRAEVTFHDYVHLVHVLRSSLVPARTMATYVEIGVWKGATSIFMSRHPQATKVVGIDGFFFEKQREEAEGYRKALQGNVSIQWIKSDSRIAVPELQTRLNGSTIDILLIDGDHSEPGARTDFERYMPLVSHGGYIVFDDFFDYQFSAGVRFAVLRMIQEGRINLNDFDIFGSVENIEGAGPVFVKDDNFYDWQKLASNEFILRKRF